MHGLSISQRGIQCKHITNGDRGSPQAAPKYEILKRENRSNDRQESHNAVEATRDIGLSTLFTRECEEVAHNEDEFPIIPDITVHDKPPLQELATPSSESTFSKLSSQRSLGQSWISQVDRDMADGSSPQKHTVLTALKSEMGRGTLHYSRSSETACGGSATPPRRSSPTAVISWALVGKMEQQPTCGVLSSFPSSSVPEVTAVRSEATAVAKRLSLDEVPNAPGAVWALSSQIFLSLLIALIFSRRPTRSQTVPKTGICQELVKYCAGKKGCIDVVKTIADTADLAADPCADFYQFTCGGWRVRNNLRPGYRRESQQNYLFTVHEALLSLLRDSSKRQNRSDKGRDVINMAAFYDSCRKFFRGDGRVAAVSDIVTAMNLNGSFEGTNAGTITTFQDLLGFVAANSLKSGLASVLSVTLRRGIFTLDAGQTLRSTLGDGHVLEFLSAVLASLGGDESDVDGLYDLDGRIHNLRYCRQHRRTAEKPSRTVSSLNRYDDDFILNLVRASRDHVGIDYEDGATERQLLGQLVFSERCGKRSFVAVPANFLMPEALVGDDSLRFLYYATVGVRLLLEWVEERSTKTVAVEYASTLSVTLSSVREAAGNEQKNKRNEEKRVGVAVNGRQGAAIIADDTLPPPPFAVIASSAAVVCFSVCVCFTVCSGAVGRLLRRVVCCFTVCTKVLLF
ncbi:hypothetical protein HPB50_017165 [Hyalomma asiaticum]|uniref:Uncharacterized protein n=1 Tax=Hyalomma asiaticum TaxID=266040 RepID=A0ACB7T8E5_HYAAI|nr:hypothetical protein HPB50_017165 [Hyalomma asiaticum]